MDRVLGLDLQQMTEENEKIDIIRGLGFVWKNRTIYILAMAACLLLSAVYCVCFIPEKYECSAVLYYPNRVSAESDSVSDRDLMDDAVEVVKQKRLLVSVEDKTDIDWRVIRDGLSITGNVSTGIIRVVFSMASAEASYKCTEAFLDVVDTELPGIVPVGDLVLLEEPAMPEQPVGKSWKKPMAAGSLTGIICGSLASVFFRWGRNERNS